MHKNWCNLETNSANSKTEQKEKFNYRNNTENVRNSIELNKSILDFNETVSKMIVESSLFPSSLTYNSISISLFIETK